MIQYWAQWRSKENRSSLLNLSSYDSWRRRGTSLTTARRSPLSFTDIITKRWWSWLNTILQLWTDKCRIRQNEYLVLFNKVNKQRDVETSLATWAENFKTLSIISPKPDVFYQSTLNNVFIRYPVHHKRRKTERTAISECPDSPSRWQMLTLVTGSSMPVESNAQAE